MQGSADTLTRQVDELLAQGFRFATRAPAWRESRESPIGLA